MARAIIVKSITRNGYGQGGAKEDVEFVSNIS